MNRTQYQAARLRLDYRHEQKITQLQEAIERENVDYNMKCGALRAALTETEPPRAYPVKCPWCGAVETVQDGTSAKLDGSTLNCLSCSKKYLVHVRAIDLSGSISITTWRVSE